MPEQMPKQPHKQPSMHLSKQMRINACQLRRNERFSDKIWIQNLALQPNAYLPSIDRDVQHVIRALCIAILMIKVAIA